MTCRYHVQITISLISSPVLAKETTKPFLESVHFAVLCPNRGTVCLLLWETECSSKKAFNQKLKAYILLIKKKVSSNYAPMMLWLFILLFWKCNGHVAAAWAYLHPTSYHHHHHKHYYFTTTPHWLYCNHPLITNEADRHCHTHLFSQPLLKMTCTKSTQEIKADALHMYTPCGKEKKECSNTKNPECSLWFRLKQHFSLAFSLSLSVKWPQGLFSKCVSLNLSKIHKHTSTHIHTHTLPLSMYSSTNYSVHLASA